MKKISIILFSLLFSGCVHMRSISTTSIPVERDTTVETEAYRFLFLLINFKNDYVNQMTHDLAKQCPDGRVEGILTKQEEIVYFPLLAHAVRVSATGYCVPPSAPVPATLVDHPGAADLQMVEDTESATETPAPDADAPDEAKK